MSGEQFDHLTMIGYQRLYDRRQRGVGSVALQLDREIGFDLVHHVTIASGPQKSFLRTTGRPEEARLAPARDSPVECACSKSRRFPEAGPRNSEILFVGRLVPWKGPLLALRMMRYLEHPEAILRFCGRGREQKRLERLVARWKLSDRVRSQDWIPRDRLLVELARAGILVHPSLHEEAGLCIAEALSLGTPVVCLDHGGPSELVEHRPDALSVRIRPSSPETAARQMAEAVDRFLFDRPPERVVPLAPKTSFRDRLLEAYEMAVGPGSVA